MILVVNKKSSYYRKDTKNLNKEKSVKVKESIDMLSNRASKEKTSSIMFALVKIKMKVKYYSQNLY